MQDKEKLFKAVTFFATVGIVLALYLLYEYIFLPAKSLCYVNTLINCEASTKGPLAETLGIPTALYGLIGYTIILFSSLKRKVKLALGMALFGLVFCLRITFLEVFFIKQLCPVCLACQINMIILFVLTLRLLKINKKYR